MPIRAVTFDFHNTLATCDAWFEVEVRTLVPDVLRWRGGNGGRQVSDATLAEAQRRYRVVREDVRVHGVEQDALACLTRVLDELGQSIDEEHARAAIDAVMRATLDGVAPLTGAVETVRELAARDLPLAVVSSAIYHPFLDWTLARFGILDCFAAIMTSASCGYYKSRTEIYEHALRTLGVCPRALVHVGDSHEYDVLTAGRLGIRTVWLSAGAEDHAADLRVSSLEGLAPILLERF